MVQEYTNSAVSTPTSKLSASYALRVAGKVCKLIATSIHVRYSKIYTYILFKVNGVAFQRDFIARGIPVINNNLNGYIRIGNRFVMHSGRYTLIGRQQPCIFMVSEGARLTIGNNVGMSCTSIVCTKQVTIRDNVRIGNNTAIYDTDFHSLDPAIRTAAIEDDAFTKTAPVILEDNVFIGAHTTILKGVSIGRNSIVGAGSLVSKSIPPNQIWAGNPARFIRHITDHGEPA